MNNALKKVRVVAIATIATVLSFPAIAAYAYVTANGAGPTRQAAVSYAVGSASLACRQRGGSLVSYTVPFAYENSLGHWSVTVSGTCFIQ
ncbi:hypothetical protein [Pseudoxanthomonas mexicana]